MHWNGSSWRTVRPPAARIPQSDSAGYGIAAVGARTLWLTRLAGSARHTFSVALLRWTGRRHAITVPTTIKAFGPMAQDGHGLWLQAQQGSATSGRGALYHYGGGHWFHQGIPSKRAPVYSCAPSRGYLAPGHCGPWARRQPQASRSRRS
jgi:hypothetical protein